MKRLKVGVIGLGEVAQIIHLPILKSLSEQYEIAAICDISEKLVEEIGKRYQVNSQYTDAHKLVAQSDLDVVFVLNSDEYHAECAIAAIKNKKHVLIEKPMALNMTDADAIIRARDEAGVKVMVGYMRRFAPAFLQAVQEVKHMDRILYARVRDIIGQNKLIIEQSSHVLRFNDIPQEAIQERAERAKRMVYEAIGDVPSELVNAYRLLCGLNSHDISAMRELLGMPKRVKAASQWNEGRYIHAIFEYDGYYASFETGVDNQRRFDAHIEVFSDSKSLKVQYDSPYIRHLPTKLIINETIGDSYQENVLRPTFKDPYTYELEYFYDVVTKNLEPKTTPEDSKEDLRIFKEIIEALQ